MPGFDLHFQFLRLAIELAQMLEMSAPEIPPWFAVGESTLPFALAAQALLADLILTDNLLWNLSWLQIGTRLWNNEDSLTGPPR